MTSRHAPTAQGFDRQPGRPMSFQPADKTICVEFAGTTIVNATRAMVMLEDGQQPVYYFSPDEVRMDLLSRTSRTSH